jgi:hypothetical protein
VNLFEVYCKKRKKSKNIILHIENGGVRRSGYTYRGGYTYRAGCIVIYLIKELITIIAYAKYVAIKAKKGEIIMIITSNRKR